jgi:hypothetical protein
VLAPVADEPTAAPVTPSIKSPEASLRQVATDGKVSVSVRQDSPLKATLRTTRKRDRDVVYAA